MDRSPIQDSPALLVDTIRHFTSLVQGELKLARAEMSQILSRAGVGIALIAVAMLMALVALNVIASAAVAYIAAAGLSVGTAALLVGGALLLIAIALVLAGKSRLSASALTPDETVKNLKKDYSTLKEASDV
jgi:hypothetical protein